MEGIIQKFGYSQAYNPVYEIDQEYHIGKVWQVFLKFFAKFQYSMLEATAYTIPFMGSYECFTITWWVVVDDKETLELMKNCI